IYVPPRNMTWLKQATPLKELFTINTDFQASLISKSILEHVLYFLLGATIVVFSEVFVYSCLRGCRNLVSEERFFERKITSLLMFAIALTWWIWTMVWVAEPPVPYQRCPSSVMFHFQGQDVSEEDWNDLKVCQRFLYSLHVSVKCTPMIAILAFIAMILDSGHHCFLKTPTSSVPNASPPQEKVPTTNTNGFSEEKANGSSRSTTTDRTANFVKDPSHRLRKRRERDARETADNT